MLITGLYDDLQLTAITGSRALPVMPALLQSVRGSWWYGNVALNSWGTNVQLVVTASNGVTSASSAFDVLPAPWSGPSTILTEDGYFGFDHDAFAFNVRAEAEKVVVVEASTNLVEWNAVHTNILGALELFYFRDPEPAAFPQRFYRARLHEGVLPAPAILMAADLPGFSDREFAFTVGGISGQSLSHRGFDQHGHLDPTSDEHDGDGWMVLPRPRLNQLCESLLPRTGCRIGLLGWSSLRLVARRTQGQRGVSLRWVAAAGTS